MVIRLGGGDLTAVAGLVGFIAGILVGVVCLKKGFSLGRAYPVRMGEGVRPVSGILTAMVSRRCWEPTAGSLRRALPMWASGDPWRPVWLWACWPSGAGCAWPAAYDAVMLRDFKLLSGFLAIWGTVTIGTCPGIPARLHCLQLIATASGPCPPGMGSLAAGVPSCWEAAPCDS